MIPRFRPTFGAEDISRASALCRTDRPQELLRRALCDLYKVRYTFLVDAGRSALAVLLRSLGRTGDVVVPAYNCPAVPDAVRAAGLHPRFADVEPGTVNCGWSAMRDVLAPGTAAVVWTHQLGCMNVDSHLAVENLPPGVALVEDAAAAFGSPLLCRGFSGMYAAILSFGFTKVLSAGSGGAILTDSDKVAAGLANWMPKAVNRNTPDAVRARMWNMLCSPSVYGSFAGLRSRLHQQRGARSFQVEAPIVPHQPSDFVCALVLVQLPRLSENLDHRRSLAELYAHALDRRQRSEASSVDAAERNAWVQFPVATKDKYGLIRYLNRHGADATWAFDIDINAAGDGHATPGAAWNLEHLVGLPCHPKLGLDGARRIADLVLSWLKRESSTTGNDVG